MHLAGIAIPRFALTTFACLLATTFITLADDAVLLLPIDAMWRYDQRGEALPPTWINPAFDDSSWPSGQALLGYDVHQYPESIRTTLDEVTPGTTNGITTYYFRTSFNFPSNASGVWLQLGLLADDGAVVYLNESEILRKRVPANQTHLTLAANQTHESYYELALVPGSALVSGSNIVAAELHQRQPATSDAAFGLTMWALWPQPLQLHAGPLVSGGATNGETRLSVQLSGTAPTYQWFRNGAAIAGAINAEYIITNTLPSHLGSYHVAITNLLGFVESPPVELIPGSDETPPTIISATFNDQFQTINLAWSEPLSRTTATNVENYTLTYLGGTNSLVITQVNSLGALMQLRGISPWQTDRDFVVVVNGVTDLAGNPTAPITRVFLPRKTSFRLEPNAVWHYRRDPVFGDLSANWKNPDFDDSEWAAARAPIASINASVTEPVNTWVDFVSPTWYLRTKFLVPVEPGVANAVLSSRINDAAIFYLNGQEIFRQGLPPGRPLDFGPYPGPDHGTIAGSTTLVLPNLVAGTNVLAAQVHQSDREVYADLPRQDFVFAADLSGVLITTNIPPLLSIIPQGDEMLLTWTEDGYALESTDALSNAWTRLTSSTSSNQTASVTVTNSQRFYRLRR